MGKNKSNSAISGAVPQIPIVNTQAIYDQAIAKEIELRIEPLLFRRVPVVTRQVKIKLILCKNILFYLLINTGCKSSRTWW
jgi:hypothetical protein